MAVCLALRDFGGNDGLGGISGGVMFSMAGRTAPLWGVGELGPLETVPGGPTGHCGFTWGVSKCPCRLRPMWELATATSSDSGHSRWSVSRPGSRPWKRVSSAPALLPSSPSSSPSLCEDVGSDKRVTLHVRSTEDVGQTCSSQHLPTSRPAVNTWRGHPCRTDGRVCVLTHLP